MIEYNGNMVKSILFLLLAISGSFSETTLACKTRYYLENNMYMKHLLLVTIIYFTLNYSYTNENPEKLFGRAISIWIFYIIFQKQHMYFTVVTFLGIAITYILDTYVDYYRKLKESSDTKQEVLDKINKNEKYFIKTRNITFYITIITVIFGFIFYSIEKYQEYGSAFSIIYLLFGKIKCKSLM